MVNKRIICLIVLTATTLIPTDHTPADDAHWPHWRGPTAIGCTATTATPVTDWSAAENVAWVAELPGEGTSTPIVWGDRVLSAGGRGHRATGRPESGASCHVKNCSARCVLPFFW